MFRYLAGFVVLSVAPLVAHSEVLPEGAFRIRQTFSYYTYDSLWAGDANKGIGLAPEASGTITPLATQATTGSQADPGNVQGFIATTNIGLGFRQGVELDAHVSYKALRLTGANEGNREDGEQEAGISEIGARIIKTFLDPDYKDDARFSLNGYIGFRAPGNSPRSPDDFLALNDGTAKFDFGVRALLGFNGFGIQYDGAFIARANDNLGAQGRSTLSVPIELGTFQFGPFATYFATFSGIDIGDQEFEAIAQSTNQPPFSEVREEYLSVGGFIAIPVNREFFVDGSVQRKVYGQNSDQGLALNLGVGYTFY